VRRYSSKKPACSAAARFSLADCQIDPQIVRLPLETHSVSEQVQMRPTAASFMPKAVRARINEGRQKHFTFHIEHANAAQN